MNKLIIISLMVMLAFSFSGCNGSNKDVSETVIEKSTPTVMPATTITPTVTPPEEFQPSLGGISLGDSKDQVMKAFGTTYKETVYDDELSLGEPFVKMAYDNGIMVVVGSKTQKVLEIETSSPETKNNLGVTVGDKAQDALNKYRAKYQEPDSRHGDGKLVGWFLIKDQELVIFNFEKGDGLVNVNVKPDARVERIKLSNFNYMD